MVSGKADSKFETRMQTPADCELHEIFDGVCQECPEYFAPSNDKTSCSQDACIDGQKQKLDGSCEQEAQNTEKGDMGDQETMIIEQSDQRDSIDWQEKNERIVIADDDDFSIDWK